MTSFEFAGAPKTFGSIVPLPAEPSKVEQRAATGRCNASSARCSRCPRSGAAARLRRSQPQDKVEVLQQVRIDSLDVTILRGGGKAVAKWAAAQGFELSKDAPGVLQFYSRRSPYFMAAKFDATAAAAQGIQGRRWHSGGPDDPDR